MKKPKRNSEQNVCFNKPLQYPKSKRKINRTKTIISNLQIEFIGFSGVSLATLAVFSPGFQFPFSFRHFPLQCISFGNERGRTASLNSPSMYESHFFQHRHSFYCKRNLGSDSPVMIDLCLSTTFFFCPFFSSSSFEAFFLWADLKASFIAGLMSIEWGLRLFESKWSFTKINLFINFSKTLRNLRELNIFLKSWENSYSIHFLLDLQFSSIPSPVH